VTNKQICPSVPVYVLDLEYSPTSNSVSLYVCSSQLWVISITVAFVVSRVDMIEDEYTRKGIEMDSIRNHMTRVKMKLRNYKVQVSGISNRVVHSLSYVSDIIT
jgi:hypothetical protein